MYTPILFVLWDWHLYKIGVIENIVARYPLVLGVKPFSLWSVGFSWLVKGEILWKDEVHSLEDPASNMLRTPFRCLIAAKSIKRASF